MVDARGGTRVGATHPVTEQLMTGAFTEEYHREFIGKKATWCRYRLHRVRLAVAHPFLDGHQYIDLDTTEHQAVLAAYANLLERLAIAILDDEFRLWGEFVDEPGYAEMSKSYRGEDA